MGTRQPERYDAIGRTYTATRRPDPRIAAAIDAALGDARTVVNVGAGTGAYEPPGREVVAVEPSAIMRAQRPPGAAPCVDGVAEALPFADGAFDAAMASLTLHHWADWRAGCAELRRVARRVVLFTWDPAFARALWLSDEYLRVFVDVDAGRVPSLADQAAAVGATEEHVVPVPHDCTDGFVGAWWRRPGAYLRPDVQAGISLFPLADPDVVWAGLSRLEDDLVSGVWRARHADLLAREELDLGYRLLVGG